MVTAILIGGLARSLVSASGVYLVSLFFVRFPIAHPVVMFYFLILVSLIFSSVGIIVALFAEEFEHLSICTTFVITPLIFFGGVFHSIEMVPSPIRWLTVFNPMFYMINGFRYGMLGRSDTPLLSSATIVALIFVALLTLTVYLFRIGFKLRK
jgi:ABC-2 type transport system permease protein